MRVVDYNVLPGVKNDEGEGDESPSILLAARNLLFGAKLLRDNPYPINIAEQNQIMMERTEIKKAAMNKALQYMREHMST